MNNIKSWEYTKKRELAHINNRINDDKLFKKELLRIYNRSMDNIVKEMESSYLKYAKDYGLSMNEAMERVSQFDVTKFTHKAREYVKNRDLSRQANYELRLYNLKMRVSKLDLMKQEMMLETIKLADKTESLISEKLTDTFLSELERQSGILGLSKPDVKTLRASMELIINTSLHSASFSSRIWMNQTELRNRLTEGLERSILGGYNPREWSGKLRDLVKKEMGNTGKENSFFNAFRIAVTETARVQEETQLRSLKAGGYKKYVWIAEPTACHICSPFDGEVFSIDGSSIGKDLPPMHPFCRCSIAAFESSFDYDK